jgi:hypothetical protein
LEAWAKEVLDTPSGPVGRRARWHQIFSKYDLTVGYIPGKENTIADILSRWAYPASQALRDISKHGSAEDKREMEELIREEREDEKNCLLVKVKNQPNARNMWIRGVVTRSGKEVAPNFVDDASGRGTESVESPGGINTTEDAHSQGPREFGSKKGKRRVTFWDGVDPAGNLVTNPKLPTNELPRGGTGGGGAPPTPSATPKLTKSAWERD